MYHDAQFGFPTLVVAGILVAIVLAFGIFHDVVLNWNDRRRRAGK